jgi:tetratricopeptide (TPR) repeat protein
VRSSARKAVRVITFILLAALALPAQEPTASLEARTPVAPEQVLAWQLEGLTPEEIQDEVKQRGLTEHPEEALLSALSAAGADAETVRTVRQTKAPKKIWKLGLRLPSPTDYLYEIAGAILFNDAARAFQTIELEAEKQPRNADVHLIYARLARGQEDWITAYGQVTEAIALNPEFPYAHGFRSTICYHAQLRECAMREAELFVKLRPDDAAAHIVLGQAREMLGRNKEALQAYAQAEKLHPAYSAVYAGKGAAYWQMGEFERAVESYEQAIRMDKGNVEYYGGLAQVYLAKGDAKRAVEQLKKAKELAPDRPEILFALGNAYLAGEHYDAAIREYQEMIGLAPDSEVARVQLAKALRAQGREEEAEREAIGPQTQGPLKPR